LRAARGFAPRFTENIAAFVRIFIDSLRLSLKRWHQMAWLKSEERRATTMACMTLFAQPLAMATTQLARVLHYENTCRFEGNVERNSLSMSWVVVTDENGNRKLQIQWAPSEDIL